MKLYDLKPLDATEPEFGLWAAALQDTTREWREELGEVSEDAIVWQPFPGGHSIGALILHMAECEAYWIEQVINGNPMSAEVLAETMSEEIDQYNGAWPTAPRQPLSYFWEIHDRYRAQTLATLATLTGPEALRKEPSWDFEVSLRWIVNHVINHESYHGGQAVLLKAIWEKSAQ